MPRRRSPCCCRTSTAVPSPTPRPASPSSTGRDDEAAEPLAARIPAGHRCDGPWRRHPDPDTEIGWLATVYERRGRVDDAIVLLRARETTSTNNCDQPADLPT
ncbi:hypothetical protein [Kitasatospora sp. NPDC058046]|uniref:hypothetical protein n=1 Tax=Kitasatospora sp. NPDC058046 TaxID=3346312 RepID=UPI0036DD41C0